MTNRTIRVYGQGFGPTAVEISVTANGSQVFNGPVPTVDQPLVPLRWPLDQSEILFSIEVPVEFQGTMPIEITVNSGSGILLDKLSINYVTLGSIHYRRSSGAQGFEFDSDEKIKYLLATQDSSLDGNPIPCLVCPPGLDGNWTLPLAVGSTFATTINIDAGLL
jgi:hypothetical protein